MKSGGIQRRLQGNGALSRYRRMVTGESGLPTFCFFELATTLLQPLPGSRGRRLRRIFLSPFFGHLGKGVWLEPDITFRRPAQISIGNGVRIGRGVTFDVKGESGYIKIGDGVHIGSNTILSCPGGTMVIGRGCRIGQRCRLGSLQGLSLGAECTLGDSVCVVGAGHGYDRCDEPIIGQPLTCRGKTILGDRVDIGAEATLLDGVCLGDGVRVEAGSLVNKNIEKGVNVAGIPAVPR